MSGLDTKGRPTVPYCNKLAKRENFKARVLIASLLAGPLNPVGLFASLLFLIFNLYRYWLETEFSIQFSMYFLIATFIGSYIVNSYCTVAVFLGIFVLLFKRSWTVESLRCLGLGLVFCLYVATCVYMLSGGIGPIVIFLGLILALTIGAPAAFVGVMMFQKIAFKPANMQT